MHDETQPVRSRRAVAAGGEHPDSVGWAGITGVRPPPGRARDPHVGVIAWMVPISVTGHVSPCPCRGVGKGPTSLVSAAASRQLARCVPHVRGGDPVSGMVGRNGESRSPRVWGRSARDRPRRRRPRVLRMPVDATVIPLQRGQGRLLRCLPGSWSDRRARPVSAGGAAMRFTTPREGSRQMRARRDRSRAYFRISPISGPPPIFSGSPVLSRVAKRSAQRTPKAPLTGPGSRA